MSDFPKDIDPSESCINYLKNIAIDLSVCVVGLLGFVSRNQSLLLLALIIIYGYGFWVFFKSGLARMIHGFFKGGGPLGSILMLLLFGLVAPVIHLAYSLFLYAACPDSLPARVKPLLRSALPRTNPIASHARGLMAGVWGWLIVLVIFAASYRLLLVAPGILDVVISIVEGAEPDGILEYFIYAIIALPIYLVLLLIGLIVHFAWNAISVVVASIIAALVSANLLPSLSGGHWPKARWVVAGSALTFAATVFVYLGIVRLLLPPDSVGSSHLLDVFTSLPFLIPSITLALVSVPLLVRWAGANSEDLFSEDTGIIEPVPVRNVQVFLEAASSRDALLVLESDPGCDIAAIASTLSKVLAEAPDEETRQHIQQRLDLLQRYRYIQDLTADLTTEARPYDWTPK